MKTKVSKSAVEQEFVFDYGIQEYYFMGEKFIGVDIKSELHSGELIEKIKEVGVEFMASLRNEIFEVIGTEKNMYSGYAINEKYFSMSFLIDKEGYEKSMKNFKNWAYAKELDKYIKYKKHNEMENDNNVNAEHNEDVNDENCECLNCELERTVEVLKKVNKLKNFQAFQMLHKQAFEISNSIKGDYIDD